MKAGVLLAALLLGGCDLLFGIPNLADPENNAAMTAHFKAAIAAQGGSTEGRLTELAMGPSVVSFCFAPAGAPPDAMPYEMTFSRNSFDGINQDVLYTPTHPSPYGYSEHCRDRLTDPS